MKTSQEIEGLKINWSNDPIWDIEDTEGFEEHKQELYIYRLEVENKRMRLKINDIDNIIYEIKRVFNIGN